MRKLQLALIGILSALLIGCVIQIDVYQFYVGGLLFAVEKYKYAAEGNRRNYLDCAFNLPKHQLSEIR